jgi:hypothetical protein
MRRLAKDHHRCVHAARNPFSESNNYVDVKTVKSITVELIKRTFVMWPSLLRQKANASCQRPQLRHTGIQTSRSANLGYSRRHIACITFNVFALHLHCSPHNVSCRDPLYCMSR